MDSESDTAVDYDLFESVSKSIQYGKSTQQDDSTYTESGHSFRPVGGVGGQSDNEETPLIWAPKKRRHSSGSYPVSQYVQDKTSMDLLQAIDETDKGLKSVNLWNAFLQQRCLQTIQQSILERLLNISKILVQVTISLHY